MKPSESIYTLINSLDKKEKRHLRLYITRYNDQTNFVQLFDAIEKAKSKDEKALKKSLDPGKIAKNLPYYKNKLFNLLVRALCDFHYGDKPALKLSDIHKQAELLLEKKLYKESKKLILKAKEEATASESFLELVKFNRLYTWILKAETTGAEHEELREQIQEENLLVLKKLVNYQEYENLAQKAYKLHRKHSQNIKKNLLSKINEVLEHPLMSSPDLAISNLAKLIYFQIRNTFNLDGNHAQSIEDYRNIIHIFETNPSFLVRRVRTYMNAQLNFITSLIYDNRFEEAEKALDRYKEMPTCYSELFDQWLLARHQHSYLQRILILFTVSGRTEKILPFIPEIKQQLIKKDWTPSLHNDAYVYYYLVRGLLTENLIDECLNWIRQFYNAFKEKDFVIAIRSSIQLMEVLANFELRHYSLAQSTILKLRRYFQDMNIYGEDEKLVISCLNKRAKNPNYSEIKAVFSQAQQKLEIPTKAPSMLLEIFIPYLKSQLQRKTLKKVILLSLKQKST